MSRMGIDQYHHVIRKTCVLNMGIWLPSGGLNRLLQHPIYLIEIEVTEQRRNHSTLGNSLLPSCLQDHLEQPHHIIILHTSSHLLEQQVVLHIIEGLYDTLPISRTFLRQ